MLYTVVSVYDRAADAFGRPIFVSSVGQAIRSFQDEVNRNASDNQMYGHPDDFDLYRLGSWDDSTGKFENLLDPQQVAIGKQLQVKGGV
ncbi:MAG: nonstructural protein [Microviridae sp.]|nr:MAG: nonstructural protein [Microviridae sp.]